MKCTIRASFPISPETYLHEVYLTAEFTRAMYIDGLGFESAEIISQDDSGGLLKRKLRVRPTMNAPKIVRKALGATQEYVETGELDAHGIWHYEVTPATLASKISITGEQRVIAKEGGCEAIFDADFVVRIFGVGGIIEKFMVGQFEENLAKQTTFTHRWIAERF